MEILQAQMSQDPKKYRSNKTSADNFAEDKWGRVFAMVIWPAFRMGQYSVNNHLYHAPQFICQKPNFGRKKHVPVIYRMSQNVS